MTSVHRPFGSQLPKPQGKGMMCFVECANGLSSQNIMFRDTWGNGKNTWFILWLSDIDIHFLFWAFSHGLILPFWFSITSRFHVKFKFRVGVVFQSWAAESWDLSDGEKMDRETDTYAEKSQEMQQTTTILKKRCPKLVKDNKVAPWKCQPALKQRLLNSVEWNVYFVALELSLRYAHWPAFTSWNLRFSYADAGIFPEIIQSKDHCMTFVFSSEIIGGCGSGATSRFIVFESRSTTI